MFYKGLLFILFLQYLSLLQNWEAGFKVSHICRIYHLCIISISARVVHFLKSSGSLRQHTINA